MRTLGIDLSANPKKTGACHVDWRSLGVTFLRRPVADEDLVEAAASSDMTAIDVPLGWPVEFVDALVAHRDGTGWPSVSVEPPADRVPLRYRVTDLAVIAAGARPLSVSTDRIGVAAMRGARLQHLLDAAGVPVDRSGVTGRIVEAYPAAALRAWGLASSQYKGKVNATACASLVLELVAGCGPLRASAAAALDGCDDDGLDAFVCALVARAVVLGHTTPPPPKHLGVARREGWIHVPTASLAELTMID